MTRKINRGGRPSRADAGRIEDKILDAAAVLFFAEGYGSVSIEEIVRRSQISKRTFYARYENKAALFRAVVHRIVHQLRPSGPATDKLFEGKTLEEILRRIAPFILKAALSPDAISLHRVMLSEATRFPELAPIMNEQTARHEAITRIARLLPHHPNPAFAAEQFLFMLTGAPQRRAMGLGAPLKPDEINKWAQDTVTLFLNGCG